MDKQQVNIEVQLKNNSTVYSRLLPLENFVIDLSEDWIIGNCVIARIVLTQIKEVKSIVAIPQFMSTWLRCYNSGQWLSENKVTSRKIDK